MSNHDTAVGEGSFYLCVCFVTLVAVPTATAARSDFLDHVLCLSLDFKIFIYDSPVVLVISQRSALVSSLKLHRALLGEGVGHLLLG